MERYKNQKGFTLIELLVVVAIIGILSAVGVVAYNGYTAGAKKIACKANHKTMQNTVYENIMWCELNPTIEIGQNAQNVIEYPCHEVFLNDMYGPTFEDQLVWATLNDIGYVDVQKQRLKDFQRSTQEDGTRTTLVTMTNPYNNGQVWRGENRYFFNYDQRDGDIYLLKRNEDGNPVNMRDEGGTLFLIGYCGGELQEHEFKF